VLEMLIRVLQGFVAALTMTTRKETCCRKFTQLRSVADVKNASYRTYDISRIRMLDLKAVDFDAKQIRTISMKGEEQIEDVSGNAK